MSSTFKQFVGGKLDAKLSAGQMPFEVKPPGHDQLHGGEFHETAVDAILADADGGQFALLHGSDRADANLLAISLNVVPYRGLLSRAWWCPIFASMGT